STTSSSPATRRFPLRSVDYCSFPCIIRGFREFLESPMSRVCQVTGKKPMKGHYVSHANNKTIRTFEPNLHYRRFWVESQNRWVRLRVSTAGLRRIDKVGVEAVLAEIKARNKGKART